MSAAATPDEQALMDRVGELTNADRYYALMWLATSGSGHPHGQAVLEALDAVSRHNERIAAVADR